MKIKQQVPLSRIVGKVDNDFNISESDWIPRAAAWIIDALSQLKCLPMERRKRKLDVVERIATFPCELNAKEIKVFDSNGCEIPALDSAKECCGNKTKKVQDNTRQIAIIDDTNKTGVDYMRVVNLSDSTNRNFVVTNNNSIELNFDTDEITVESFEVATYYDEYFDCQVPYVYDNGTLIEALCWYILFKYLSRGSHHPVYDLKSNSPVTNPFLQWNNLKSKAIASVRSDIYKDDGWRNFFYNSTFDPRRS